MTPVRFVSRTHPSPLRAFRQNLVNSSRKFPRIPCNSWDHIWEDECSSNGIHQTLLFTTRFMCSLCLTFAIPTTCCRRQLGRTSPMWPIFWRPPKRMKNLPLNFVEPTSLMVAILLKCNNNFFECCQEYKVTQGFPSLARNATTIQP